MRKQQVYDSIIELNLRFYPSISLRHPHRQMMTGYHTWVTRNLRRLCRKETLGL